MPHILIYWGHCLLRCQLKCPKRYSIVFVLRTYQLAVKSFLNKLTAKWTYVAVMSSYMSEFSEWKVYQHLSGIFNCSTPRLPVYYNKRPLRKHWYVNKITDLFISSNKIPLRKYPGKENYYQTYISLRPHASVKYTPSLWVVLCFITNLNHLKFPNKIRL